MLSAAKKFIVTELGDGRFPDPVHAFVQFLSMVPPGPVSITCKFLRVSKRQCVVNVELVRSSAALWKKPELPATVGIFTYGDLSKERGLSQASDPALRIPVPPRETECVTIDDPVVDSTPVTRKLHWLAPRSANGLWGHRLGGHNREVWISFRDGSKISDCLHLALLSDMVSPHGIYHPVLKADQLTQTAASACRNPPTRLLQPLRTIHALHFREVQATARPVHTVGDDPVEFAHGVQWPLRC